MLALTGFIDMQKWQARSAFLLLYCPFILNKSDRAMSFPKLQMVLHPQTEYIALKST